MASRWASYRRAAARSARSGDQRVAAVRKAKLVTHQSVRPVSTRSNRLVWRTPTDRHALTEKADGGLRSRRTTADPTSPTRSGRSTAFENRDHRRLELAVPEVARCGCQPFASRRRNVPPSSEKAASARRDALRAHARAAALHVSRRLHVGPRLGASGPRSGIRPVLFRAECPGSNRP